MLNRDKPFPVKWDVVFLTRKREDSDRNLKQRVLGKQRTNPKGRKANWQEGEAGESWPFPRED